MQPVQPVCANLTVEIGHFPTWPLTEIQAMHFVQPNALHGSGLSVGAKSSKRDPCYQGMTSLIVRSAPDLLTRPSRAVDSIIGQFCRKNVVAS